MKMSRVVVARCVKNKQLESYDEVAHSGLDRVWEHDLTIGGQYEGFGFSTWQGGLGMLNLGDYNRLWRDSIYLFSIEPQLVAADWFVSLYRAEESYLAVVYNALHVRVGYLEYVRDFEFADHLALHDYEQMMWFWGKKVELEGAAADREEFAGYGYIEDDPEFSAMEVSVRDLLVDGLSGVVGLSDLLEIVGLLIGLNEARFVCVGESDELLTVDSQVVEVSCARMPDGWWVATQKISHAPDVKGRSCSEVLAFGREDIVKDAQWVERLWGQKPQAAV